MPLRSGSGRIVRPPNSAVAPGAAIWRAPMFPLLPTGRWQRLALLACAALAVAHQAARWDWFIDDAAICFAYARNVAAGHGFVPFPGGERVEGVSDPTWMALLTAFQALGFDGFTVAKPLALALTVATLPVLWRAARHAMPDDDGTAALAAPFAFATFAQTAIWGASGLENPLWSFLLAVALLTTAVDAREGRFVRSSTAWLLLAWTRPEGIAYAAVGGGWWLLLLWRAGHRPLRPTVGWLLWFFVPTAAMYGLRLWYFAWPFSNTWYAKVASRPTYPFSWNGRGWEQLRDWAGRLWYGWMFPVYLFGMVGRVGRGAAAAWILAGLVVVSLAWPGPAALTGTWWYPELPPPPPVWVGARMAAIVALGFGTPWVVHRRPGWDVLGLSWLCAALSMAFSVYADGDWMGAYRWMSLLTAPAAVLFAAGWREASAWLRQVVPDEALASVGSALVLFALVPPNLNQTRDHSAYNRNETPSMVAFRARFTRDLARRTFFEGEVVNLDMDMGAHLWFVPEVREIDMAGLVDVPMSRHWYHQRAFVEEYVFGEHPPTFAHVHGWWAKESQLRTYPYWERWMVEVGPYVDQKPLGLHPGVFASRALFTEPTWTHGDARRVAFDGGVLLHGVHLPTAGWAAGGEGYLELGFTRDRPEDFRLIAFLHRQGRVVALDLPVGYGEYPPSEWRVGEEVYVGRHAFALPANLAPGAWDLGLVLLDADGRVLPVAADAVPGEGVVFGRGNDAVYAVGEVRFPGAVTVGTREDADREEEAAMARSAEEAAAGRCEAAEAALVVAKRTHPRSWNRHAKLRAAARGPIATCWAVRAETAPDPEVALAVAHRWDPDDTALARIGGPVGERLWAQGLAARAAGDAETAYRAFSSLLGFQPWRSWARRYAEDARDLRLGLVRGQQVEMQSRAHPDPSAPVEGEEGQK